MPKLLQYLIHTSLFRVGPKQEEYIWTVKIWQRKYYVANCYKLIWGFAVLCYPPERKDSVYHRYLQREFAGHPSHCWEDFLEYRTQPENHVSCNLLWSNFNHCTYKAAAIEDHLTNFVFWAWHWFNKNNRFCRLTILSESMIVCSLCAIVITVTSDPISVLSVRWITASVW